MSKQCRNYRLGGVIILDTEWYQVVERRKIQGVWKWVLRGLSYGADKIKQIDMFAEV